MLFLLLSIPVLMQSAPVPSPPRRTLRLDEAVRTALQNQPNILQAQAASEAARGRSDQARSGLLPQINGTASYQHIYGNVASRGTSLQPTGQVTGQGTGGVNTTIVPGGSNTYDFFSVGASASQL